MTGTPLDCGWGIKPTALDVCSCEVLHIQSYIHYSFFCLSFSLVVTDRSCAPTDLGSKAGAVGRKRSRGGGGKGGIPRALGGLPVKVK